MLDNAKLEDDTFDWSGAPVLNVLAALVARGELTADTTLDAAAASDDWPTGNDEELDWSGEVADA